MKLFYMLDRNYTYQPLYGYRISVPGYEHLLLFAHVTRAGSSRRWWVTEGWTGLSLSKAYGNQTKKELIEDTAWRLSQYEERGRTIDEGIRSFLEQGYMAPMPLNPVFVGA